MNVKIGSPILKEMFGQSDGELVGSVVFDTRYQHALNTTSFQEQPLSVRSLARFRAGIFRHYMETGEDLLETEMKRIAKDFAHFMSIEPTLKRMDSLMISTNARIMGKVDGETALFCLGYNLKRAMNLLGFEKIMAAIA